MTGVAELKEDMTYSVLSEAIVAFPLELQVLDEEDDQVMYTKLVRKFDAIFLFTLAFLGECR